MDTITITFPEVKVNTEIKDLTFDILEDMLFEILQNIARKVFEKAITDIDKTLRSKRESSKRERGRIFPSYRGNHTCIYWTGSRQTLGRCFA